MLEIVVRENGAAPQVLDPVRGCLVPLDAATDEIAAAHDGLAELIRLAREAQTTISDELVGRMDKRGKWTASVGGFKVTAPSPQAGTTSYDAKPLREALLALVADEVLDREAVDDAVEVVRPAPSFKAKVGGINALLKLGRPEVTEAIDAHKIVGEPPARKATVKRVAQAQ